MQPAEANAAPAAARAPLIEVALITLLGAALRLAVADQPLFADELATYWVISERGFGGVLSTVHSNAEITPPLYFVLSWAATQISSAPEFVRAPSLVAGTLTIPLVYLLGARTVGRPAALVATALTALSPFMIYYSAEARAYGLVMGLVALSTLAMLLAVDTGRARWWVLYAACSCAAVYTHYTCVFALAAQFLWLVWAHPEGRRPALAANVAAVLLFLPWVTGLRNDFDSPTAEILSALSPFSVHDVRVSVEHWVVGYAYAYLPLRQVPGVLAVVLLMLALGGSAVAGLGRVIGRADRAWLPGGDRRLLLVVALALSVPLGEIAVSLVSTNLFTTRNLAASWPALALGLGAVLTAAGPRLRYVTVLAAVAAFGIGAVRMLDEDNQRPDYAAAADFIDRQARPGDVVVDATGAVSPGPLTPLDVTLGRPIPIYRAAAPEQRAHPFDLRDRLISSDEALARAAKAADGHTIYLIAAIPPDLPAFVQKRKDLGIRRFPAGYRVSDVRVYGGFLRVTIRILERPAG